MKQIDKINHFEVLKQVGLRVTKGRVSILEFLEQVKEPVDVSSILKFLKSKKIKADPATVFRIMNVFTKKGIALQVQFQDGKARYELASKGDHHHLICEKCESIEDITGCTISVLEKKIEEKKKFLVKSHSLEFFGICSRCQ